MKTLQKSKSQKKKIPTYSYLKLSKKETLYFINIYNLTNKIQFLELCCIYIEKSYFVFIKKAD